ncbi:hypothetical protein [Bosea sp. (in: a-proteobacteria)]|uniref:hypothetical protein n=1 Tax=Bosea sp. (in: a-proteobacteria) TaxID=1871050 RepID=UPI002B469CFE|nr:hypothetical protein [Bosea sp. (in: a-proteobacteria)]WRH59174.1 MAG: hypothetical protein RSE11_05135 [Bosea sp. (in: a-proteobacteria)]
MSVDGPVAQFKLICAIVADPRARKIHDQVAAAIIARYYPLYKNARASVSFLEVATGLTRGSVATASADLVEWGYFTMRKGIGKRPTEFTPIWNSVLQPPDATSVLQPPDPTVLQPQDAKSDSVLWPPDQTYLQLPEYNSGILVGRCEPAAAPTAPPDRGGVAPGPAHTARDPEGEATFDEFWQAYPRRHGRRKAREAWNSLGGDKGLLARVIEAAGRLRDHHMAQHTEARFIPYPHSWLAGERYEEDLPAAFSDPRSSPKEPKEKSVATKVVQAESTQLIGQESDIPTGRHSLVIENISHSGSMNDGQYVTTHLRTVSGECWKHTICTWHENDEIREAGQMAFRTILADLRDPKDAVGMKVSVFRDTKSIKYEPIITH